MFAVPSTITKGVSVLYALSIQMVEVYPTCKYVWNNKELTDPNGTGAKAVVRMVLTCQSKVNFLHKAPIM